MFSIRTPKYLKRPVGPLINLLKNMSTFRLNCLVHGEPTERTFAVDISDNMAIIDLKKKIKIEKQPEFDQVAPDKLALWKVKIPLRAVDDPILKAFKDNPKADIEGVLKGVKLTDPTYEVGEHWREPPKFHIHVIVEPPCK
jgi:2-methylcitrate dehydratase PrpD